MLVIEVRKRRGIRQKYHFVIVQQGNGKVIATSENYLRLSDCEDSARLFKFPMWRKWE